jgi:hypothetical protein
MSSVLLDEIQRHPIGSVLIVGLSDFLRKVGL